MIGNGRTLAAVGTEGEAHNRGEIEPRFVIARSGRIHEYQCLSLTHDGPCQCPLVLGVDEPRRCPKVIYG